MVITQWEMCYIENAEVSKTARYIVSGNHSIVAQLLHAQISAQTQQPLNMWLMKTFDMSVTHFL